MEAQSQHGDYSCDFSAMGGFGSYVIAIKHNIATGLGFPAFQLGSSGQNVRKLILLNNWGTSSWKSMDSAFANLANIILANNDIPDFSEVTSFSRMLQNTPLMGSLDVSQWVTSSATDMSSMFKQTKIKSLDTSNWNTELVTSMSEMFKESLIINLDAGNWNTESVTDMSSMFYTSCLSNLNTTDWNTSLVKNMSDMFAQIGEGVVDYCYNSGMVLSLDVSQWDTSSVEYMSSMFNNTVLENLDVKQWDTSAVISMSSLFSHTTIPDLDVSLWNTSSVLDMTNMFYAITLDNLDLSQWDTSSVTNMGSMFYHAKINNINFGQWDIPNVNSMSQMFNGYKLTTETYDELLENFTSQVVQQTVDFDAGDSHYCSQTAVAARDNLIANNNWDIQDLGYDCSTEADFVIMVKTDNVGESTDTQFTIPTNPNVTGYNYSVDCDNNGIFEAELINSSYTCNYLNAGIYKVRIVHDSISQLGFPSLFFNNSGDILKLLSIEQWGDGIWTNMTGAFFGASNLEINAQDNPDFSLIVDMMDMFTGVSLPSHTYDALLIHLRNTVHTTNITFSAGSSHYCIPEARVSKKHLVEDLGWQINDNGWQCFKGSSADFIFTVAYGTVIDINHHTPQGIEAIDYNIDCDNDGIIEHYHVQTGRSCYFLNDDFSKSKTIRIEHNLPNNEGLPFFGINTDRTPLVSINQWGTGRWQSMDFLFYDTDNVWVSSEIPNTSEMLSTEGMFKLTTNIHIDVSNWDMSSVTNMAEMFNHAKDFSLDTLLWNTSSVLDMDSMFQSSNIDIETGLWDTSSVTNMNSLFSSSDVDVNISDWKISSVTNMNNIFKNVVLSDNLYDDILVNFGSQNVNTSLNLDVGEARYCSLLASQARSNLIDNFNWTITDGGHCDFIFNNGFEN